MKHLHFALQPVAALYMKKYEENIELKF